MPGNPRCRWMGYPLCVPFLFMRRDVIVQSHMALRNAQGMREAEPCLSAANVTVCPPVLDNRHRSRDWLVLAYSGTIRHCLHSPCLTCSASLVAASPVSPLLPPTGATAPPLFKANSTSWHRLVLHNLTCSASLAAASPVNPALPPAEAPPPGSPPGAPAAAAAAA
jgi:hypothetical protein